MVVGDERQLVTLRWTDWAHPFLEDLFVPAAQGVETRPASIFKNNSENSRNYSCGDRRKYITRTVTPFDGGSFFPLAPTGSVC